MQKKSVLSLLLGLFSLLAFAQHTRATFVKNTGMDSESYLSATFNGSWCWFSDPRAVYYEGKHQRTYMGWIDNWGDIVVGFYDHKTGNIKTHVVADNIEVDDHNTPSLLFDEQGRLMVTYNLHTVQDMPLFMVKAKNPEDISEWEETQVLRFNDTKFYPDLGNRAKHCYTNPLKLGNEKGKLYLFWRGHDGKPTYTTSVDNGKNWDAGKVYFMPDPLYKFRRPYTKIYSNSTDKIHFVFTDGHPRNEKTNSIYYAVYKNGAFYKASGEKITDITALPMQPDKTDRVYNAATSGVKAWNWDIAEDPASGHPVIAYAKFPNDSTHIYCYARWDGKKWQNYELINAGKWFPETQKGKTEPEPNYSGGMSIDKEDPNIVYLSVNRDSVFEIEKWTTSNGGKTWKIEFITKGSSKDNVRPFAVRGAKADNPLQVLWMQNTRYIHYHASNITKWENRFHSSIKMNLPSPIVSNVLQKDGIEKLMRRAADWQLANPLKFHLLDWHYAAFFVGLMDLYDQTNDDRYVSEMYNIGQHYNWKTLDEILHADRVAIIDMYERLYEKYNDPAMLEKAKWAMDIIMSRGTKKKVMVNFKDNVYYNEWLTWCDALFMSPPVFARMTNLTGEQKYVDYMNTMWWKTSDYLYSPDDSLIYRDDRYIGNLSNNGKKIFWGRGNGWVIAGLARILKDLPQDSPYRPKFEQQFKEMAHKLLSIQLPDGLWTVSLLDPDYLRKGESSGSAFFTYALAYGLNSRLIDARYRPQVEKAWKALSANVNQNGRLGYVQQVAGDPYPFKEEEFQVYATGAYLMAGKEMIKLDQASKIVNYSSFGAKGDGKTDDMEAIVATHDYANKHGLKVNADEGATYYIGGKDLTAIIQTDTDFGTANFIIDDTRVVNQDANIFSATSALQPIKISGISSLKKYQQKMNISIPDSCLIRVVNANVKHYIRKGLNLNNGTEQTDLFLVDKNGIVDQRTPVIWDFDQITEIIALPVDKAKLTITGGRFVTIANTGDKGIAYYCRGIGINRSNVTVNGLEHRITGEGENGSPYRGILNISDGANITIQNSTVTGHKTYSKIGSAGLLVAMGSYDIHVNRALNVSIVNCKQFNDINDSKYWGVFASNFAKNLLYDNCSLSRFDSHMGVANVTIRNSTLGHQGINAIGCGLLKVENSTIHNDRFINLRSDYGSTWQGEVVIRNCVQKPGQGKKDNILIFGGNNSGTHDFGYTCYMPERITIENLHIVDSKQSENKNGPAVFDNFNPKMTDEAFVEKFPYIRTKEVMLKNVTTASGKNLRISDNPFMFKEVKLTIK